MTAGSSGSEMGAGQAEARTANISGPVPRARSPEKGRPLSGKTVVVTRAAHQAPALSGRLTSLGASVVEVHPIAIGPPADGGRALSQEVRAVSDYDWLVFTSANAVDALFTLLADSRALVGVKVATVGPATAAALRSHGVLADLVPKRHLAEGLLAEFPPAPPGPGSSRRVLLPQAAGARAELREGLCRLGWQVDAVEAYRTVPQRIAPHLLEGAARADAICFASSSAVESYLDQAGPVPPVVACIGPVTAQTARSRGLQVSAQASQQTLDSLVDALVNVLGC
ncbi:MAG: uroporphyrinogen-III synthase [Acidimicrobiales bacterium]